MKKRIGFVSIVGFCLLPLVGMAHVNKSYDTRQKITAVVETLDQLQPMAADLIEIALAHVDSTTGLQAELSQQRLQEVYRFSLVLQQAHGTLQRIYLQNDSAGPDNEAVNRPINDVARELTDIELKLLDSRSRILALMSNPDERIKIYKLIAILNKSKSSSLKQ